MEVTGFTFQPPGSAGIHPEFPSSAPTPHACITSPTYQPTGHAQFVLGKGSPHVYARISVCSMIPIDILVLTNS